MLRVALRTALAHRLRLFTTGLAVSIGVAFIAGTLILTDTISQTFDEVFTDINSGRDAVVRQEATFDTVFGFGDRGRIEADVVERIRQVDGVAVAEAEVSGFAQLVGSDGEPLGMPGQGPPTFGVNWTDTPELNPMTLVEGRAPEASDEVVIDRASSKNGDLAVGDRTDVLTREGPVPVTVVGIAKFGDADSPAGASITAFESATARRVLAAGGLLDSVAVVAEAGVEQQELVDRIESVLPAGLEAITGTELIDETRADLREALGFFDNLMLTFAVVALFVGSFAIYNTFGIVVAQRMRDTALLRAVGASRVQVLGAVLIESLLLGFVAAGVGLAGGFAIAAGLKALLAGFGIDLPAGGVVFQPSTAVIALLAGVIVTVVASLGPARRAARVAPLAALRDVDVGEKTWSVRRLVVGAFITAAGGVLLGWGLVSEAGIAAVGGGAGIVFIGVAVLAPLFARPVSRALGAPLPRLRGAAGTLARENASRNPTRTANTAAALMIGVGLVGFVTIMAASIQASIDRIIDDAFDGDFVVDSNTFGFGGFPPELASRLQQLPEVEAASGIRGGMARIDGDDEEVFAVDPVPMDEIVDVGVVEGDLSALDDDGIAALDDVAEDRGWEVGEQLEVTFAQTGPQTFTVEVIYTESELAGRMFMGLPAFEANIPDQFDFQVYVKIPDDVEPEDARASVESVAGDYANAEVQDRTEFKEQQAGQIDQLLGLFTALLGLAVVIALLGIGNTLALSVLERTRELGLLRAVGMTRRQTRTTVRWESVIVALFGTVMGLVIAVAFGWSVVTALGGEGIEVFRLPVVRLGAIAALAVGAGLLAAIGPARRAAKLNVLDAIAAE